MVSARIPGIADFHPIDLADDVVIARAPNQLAALDIAHRPRHHLTVVSGFERARDVRIHLFWMGNHRVPQVPEPTVLDGYTKFIGVPFGERLEGNAVALEDDGYDRLHVTSLASLGRSTATAAEYRRASAMASPEG